MNPNSRHLSYFALLLMFFTVNLGCRQDTQTKEEIKSGEVKPSVQGSNSGKVEVAGVSVVDDQDRDLLTFGQFIDVQEHSSPDFTNPHELAAHAVWECSQGRTQELLMKMPHVETDPGLGRAFVGFLKEFGPDLEKFRGDPLKLKFQAYKVNDDTTVWYYYLCGADNRQLEHSPWVTVHRSRSTGRCALTGIFLHDPDIGNPPPLPDGLITKSAAE